MVSDREELGRRGLKGGQFGMGVTAALDSFLWGGAFLLCGAMVLMGWKLHIIRSDLAVKVTLCTRTKYKTR